MTGEVEVSGFALTFEYYQTEPLSNRRLAVDSGFAIVQAFLRRLVSLSSVLMSFLMPRVIIVAFARVWHTRLLFRL